MNRFVARYWRPVFYFLRTRGYPLHDAEDLTQEFFLRFLERDWIGRADPARGRFRTYLLTVLTRFLADQGQWRAPRQKRFDDRMVAISTLLGESERTFEPHDRLTPESVFMREWAAAAIRAVEQSVRHWCEERGRPDWFEIFALHHFPPPGAIRPTQQEIAARFHLSRDQVRYALEETNGEFVTRLRAEVIEQVGSAAEIDGEIAEFAKLLGY
jgi:RNA polymerase sigma-70 factor (ECF subfamily)